ncbi:MAG: HNH endonuclease [Lachnospiraceae bacterium]|nr:HNH endonuclease [Lachnospiraceae bacterium]
MDANITKALRKRIYARDGYRCALCDCTDGLQIHHFFPRGMGGSDNPSNLITLCWRCHALAHGLDVLSMKDRATFDYYWQCQQDEMAEYLSGIYKDWPNDVYSPHTKYTVIKEYKDK